MTARKLATLAVAAALLATGCGSDNGGAETVTRIVAKEIAQNTGDSTVPIQLNDLPVSDQDTRDDTDPAPLD